MLQEGMNSSAEPPSKFRIFVRFFWTVPAIAVLFAGWTFYSRWQNDQRLQQEALEKQRMKDQRAVEAMGGDRFEILHFYALPAIVAPGGEAQICYGVSNAKAVRLEPQSNPVWPAVNRCVNVRPAQTTTYTLTITDAAGHTLTEKLTVQVAGG